jgi:alpha-mannosidase
LGQCQGIREFELAIRPFGPGNSAAEIANEAERWHHGFRTISLPVREDLWVQGRPWVQESDIAELFTRPNDNENKPKLPRSFSFLRLEGEGVVLSTVKQQLEGKGVIVRFYNAGNSESQAYLETTMPIIEAWKGNLMEQPVNKLEPSGHTLKVVVKPKEIVTLILTI